MHKKEMNFSLNKKNPEICLSLSLGVLINLLCWWENKTQIVMEINEEGVKYLWIPA